MARDSLDIVELVMEIERQFGRDFRDEALERIRLPDWRRLQAIVARVCGMRM
jgi:acyl carrier protein